MPYGFERLDPESLDYLIRTVYGEAGNEPARGQQAVAAVIGNRMRQGGQGVRDVVLAPNQFEPWGDAAARNRMLALQPNDPRYQAIRQTVLSMQTDPTGGAMNFYAPVAQAQLGRSAPAWATGPYQDIGGHRFYGGNPAAIALPPTAPVGRTYALPQVAQPQSAPQMMSPDTGSILAQMARAGVRVGNVNPTFAERLVALRAAAPPNVQDALRINSGVRTREEQAKLYAKYMAGQGPLAAKPGSSRHERGDALDLWYGQRGTPQREEVKNWVLANAPKHGLSFPLLHRGEDWHVEMTPGEGTGGRVMQMPAGLGGEQPQNVTDLARAAPAATETPQPTITGPSESGALAGLLANLAGGTGTNTSGNLSSSSLNVSPGILGSGAAQRVGQASDVALSSSPALQPLPPQSGAFAVRPFEQNPLIGQRRAQQQANPQLAALLAGLTGA